MAAVFLIIPIPADRHLVTYRRSLYGLILAYSLIGIVVFFKVYLHLTFDYLPLYFIGISSAQSVLLIFVNVSLINPGYVTRTRVVRFSIPVVFFVLFSLILSLSWGYPILSGFTDLCARITTPSVAIRPLFYLFYIGQFSYFIWVFYREKIAFERQMANFSADSYELNLSVINVNFIITFSFGFFSIINCLVTNLPFRVFFTFMLVAFYFIFAIRYIQYPRIYKNYFSLLDKDDAQPATNADTRVLWEAIKTQVIENKLYARQGITIEDLAREFNTNRTYLSSMINKTENINFNNWINSLRIAEAKRLFSLDPGLSVAQVSEQVGYSEQSNFCRQFKINTNHTPSAWKKQLL